MNCRDVLARLYEYLDTELDETDRKSVDIHLEICGDCLKKYKLEDEFNKVVRAKSAAPADVASLKSRVLSEIDKMDRIGGGGNSRNLLYLFAPLAAAIVITMLIINPWSKNGPDVVYERLGTFAAEHSKCLGDLKAFEIESSNPQEVYAALSHFGVLPQQLFSNQNGEVDIMRGGTVLTKYGKGAHLDYHMANGNVSIFVLPDGRVDLSDMERVEEDGKVFYFGSCPKYQYVVWECDGQNCVAVSEMDNQKLMGFATAF